MNTYHVTADKISKGTTTEIATNIEAVDMITAISNAKKKWIIDLTGCYISITKAELIKL